MRFPAVVASLLCFVSPVAAEPLKVVTDIAPVHGLVSMVMKGLGRPGVLLSANASPHDLSLRPSQAALVAEADVIFWIGDSLSPQLEGPLETLAPNAQRIALESVEGTELLPNRKLTDFNDDDHDGHADHDDHEDHADHDGHDHGAFDPHVWLDPDNAMVWVDLIAETLAALDAENAALYASNAIAAKAKISEVTGKVEAELTDAPNLAILVSHDAFQYFEHRFDRFAVGAVSLSDAQSPSPRHLAELRERIEAASVACVLVEPLTNVGLIDAASGATQLTAVEIAPIGADLPLGEEFYPALIEHLGAAFVTCLTGDAQK